jgi:hypothetical protein
LEFGPIESRFLAKEETQPNLFNLIALSERRRKSGKELPQSFAHLHFFLTSKNLTVHQELCAVDD